MNIIQTIVTAFKDFMTGVGSSIVDFFQSSFVGAEGQLTTFAVVSLSFIGLSLAIGFVYAIIRMIKR